MALIPKRIFQSWKTKELSEKMAKIVQQTKEMNPDYDYELYDDNDCRSFLLSNFGQNYANAFDVLIPGAFKCDFWRYAVLYVYGGVYMDMDMTANIPFREILKDSDQFVSILDIPHIFNCGIYQAFIACRPKHPIMLLSLQLTFSNIVTRRHEQFDRLSITGPTIVGIAMNLYWNNKKTHDDIKEGEYPNGIRLLNINEKKNGKNIFNLKFEGYGESNYLKVNSFYTDDPRKKLRNKIEYIFYAIIVLVILGILGTYIFYKKYKNCILRR